ncbi:MAG: hypothetical protein CL843_06940 [Crocinitomicaceae bacterium]|nr:hypothetical protein [Crocinitomicaceae bacterium]
MYKTRFSLLEIISLVCIVLGISAAFINFLHTRSLWVDEIMLASNIVSRSVEGLFKPLAMHQMAPIGFLLVEKGFSSLLGQHDWTLRLFPFLAFIASIPLLVYLSFALTQNREYSFMCAGMFSITTPLIYYSAEVKQYMSDVLVCILILYTTIRFIQTKSKKRLLIYSITGALVIWFSNTSIILLAAMGTYTLFHCRNECHSFHKVVLLHIPWLISFIAYYALFIHNHPNRTFMHEFWEQANAFLPQDIGSTEFYLQFYNKVYALILLFTGTKGVANVFLLALIPAYTVAYRKNKSVFYISLAPLLVQLLLSYLELYPFFKRLVLYLLPIVILLYSYSSYEAAQYLKTKYSKLWQLSLLIPLLVLVPTLLKHVPFEKEEVQKSLKVLNQNILPSDSVYVYYGAQKAMSYYKHKYSNIKEDRLYIGHSYRKNWESYSKKIEQFNHPTYWYISSHQYWIDRNGTSEEAFILNAFRSNGYKVVIQQEFEGSSVYKFKKHSFTAKDERQ